VVADRHVVAGHLDAVAQPDVLDEAGAVAGDGGVGVDLLARRERHARRGAPGELAVDDAPADVEHGVAGGDGLAGEGAGGGDEFESGHAAGDCSRRACPNRPSSRAESRPPPAASMF